MSEAIKRRNIEVHRVKPANAPDLLSFVNDIELNKYMWIFTWWKLEIKIKYSKMKKPYRWNSIFVAHQLLMRYRNYFCGAPEAVRHRNSLFLWRTLCVGHRKMWDPHPANPNHWFSYFCGALVLVHHINKTFCGALFVWRIGSGAPHK
jgi:hypothetical protein